MTIKRIARRVLGPLYDPLQRRWSGARHALRIAAAQRQRDRVWRALTRNGIRILGGPFAGMHYIADPSEGSVYPKLAGTYEAELHEVIETIIATPYDTIIDIGSAEGYYAVGLALRMPNAIVHAYDVDARAHAACAELARRNGVEDRVKIEGAFVPFALGDRRVLVIADCEGCERHVLDPLLFANADLLVELHEFLDPGVTATVLDRFRATHAITLIDTTARSGRVQRLSATDSAFAMDERRPAAMQWAWMTARER